jgi:hypothetical protein
MPDVQTCLLDSPAPIAYHYCLLYADHLLKGRFNNYLGFDSPQRAKYLNTMKLFIENLLCDKALVNQIKEVKMPKECCTTSSSAAKSLCRNTCKRCNHNSCLPEKKAGFHQSFINRRVNRLIDFLSTKSSL